MFSISVLKHRMRGEVIVGNIERTFNESFVFELLFLFLFY